MACLLLGRAAAAGPVHDRLRHRHDDQLPEPGGAEAADRCPCAERAGGRLAHLAAGIFTGILSGTGMVDAMARSVTASSRTRRGAPPLITGLVSIPFTFLISNDAFFGILPILAEAGAAYGHSAEAMAGLRWLGRQVHLLSPLVASDPPPRRAVRGRFWLASALGPSPWRVAACVMIPGACVLLGGIRCSNHSKSPRPRFAGEGRGKLAHIFRRS